MISPRELLSKAYHFPEKKHVENKFNSFCKNYSKEYDFRAKIIPFVEGLKSTDVAFSFSKSCGTGSIYSATYACLLLGMYSELSDEYKLIWGKYFDSHQRSDGLYIDKTYDDDHFFSGSEGWGVHHLIPHIVIALDRIGHHPKYEFSYLDKFKNPDNVVKWLQSLDYTRIWASSNEIMNYGVMLQYARDRMGVNFNDSITAMEEFLINILM